MFREEYLLRIILHLSEPEAFDKLNSLNNIKLKMYQTEGEKDGFHTKGYIFKDGKIYRILWEVPISPHQL
ncbi:MAG: hypothetical protein ACLTS6_22080 [Anaerobutyricum sp.]